MPRDEQQKEAFTTPRDEGKWTSVPRAQGGPELSQRCCLEKLWTEREATPARETSTKERENDKELVILLSTPTRSLVAEPNEMPSHKGNKII